MNTLKRPLAIAAAVGLLAASPVSAIAQEAPSQGVNVATIDATKTGSLTIYKRANPTSLGEPTGLKEEAPNGEALPGAGFTLYKVTNADIRTNDGLVAAAKLTPDSAKTGEAVGVEQLTDTDGAAKWSELPVGVYLARETKPVDGYQKALDFLVFVPMTAANKEQGGTSWQYDVVAYPKNYNQNEPTKTVKDSGTNVGEKVSFDIKATPRPMPADKRTLFRIVDELDSSLTVTEDDITVTGLDKLDKDDYTVTVSKKTAESPRQTVTVEVSGDKAQKIENGKEVTVTINATVASKPEGGRLKNQANVFENNPVTLEEEKGKPTNETETLYGGVKFKKVDERGNGLDGAKFEVYGAKKGEGCEDAVQDGEARQEVGGKTVFEPVADDENKGTVTIDGLHVNDFADNAADPKNKYVKYCLLETQAPKGFELLSTPVEFELTSEQAGKLLPLKVGDTEGQIVNIKDTTTRLPNTGGIGVLIFVLAGLAVIGAGVFAARRNASA